ncbi:hypothetical protein A2160_00615 [Candidatus Beckwithbacteria bacterium RBG_13_42_9]|uniref:Sporulation stage II protein D amidase enhancer LytB N-terminal domain-containing protein n=1 Tax=Candidatus Beckwithbacteria bacterium RBG_13_42_9 TaxID=1797457 RepID=A0A1F5E4F9_9BACT|nr:MAG: hypothetical protein A2160_00615 [Candidatus Beckwithbacteria bacterium RBG_13_42_9]
MSKLKAQSVKFKFLKVILFISVLATCSLLLVVKSVRADELEDLAKQIADLESARQQSINATKPLEGQLSQLDQKLQTIQAGLNQAAVHLANLEQSIVDRELAFKTQYAILADRVEAYYKHLRGPSAFFYLISSDKASELTKQLSYQQAVTDDDKATIVKISEDLAQLQKDKIKVEKDRELLASLQQQLDQQAQFFRKEIKGAKEYQAKLSQQIAQLSAKQQQLLAQKLGSLNLPTSLGAGPLYCTDDRKIDPGFGSGFAFFTFGIPHRVGLNQYGAYGRAKANQGYQDILRAYFDNVSFEKRDNVTLKVQGYGEKPLEDYLLGIYEMPGDWPLDALKAQVVAARSYALAYTGNGANEICTTQACQVYKGGNKGGAWEQAVRETAGEVMVSGGQVITAWYASTAGGYTFRSADVGWNDRPWTKRVRDTSSDVGNFSDLFNNAFDKDSPCFYAAQGWRAEYGKSAWLKPSEVADIVNVLLLAKNDGSTQTHLSQADKPNPDGTDTWDAEKVKQELRNRHINPFSNISDVGIDWDRGLGRTTNVTFNGDGGSATFNSDEFKNYFNLRAPANIQIVGPLYNVEKR